MFVVSEIRRFSWPVKVRFPSQSTPGEYEVEQFIGHFKLIGRERAVELGEAMEAARREGPRAAAAQEISQIAEVMEGWGDVIDAEKAPVPFSVEALTAACRHPQVVAAINEAYVEGAAGGRLGN